MKNQQLDGLSGMQEEISNNLENPSQLERLYRDNKSLFTRSFNSIYAEIQEHTTAQIWKERLGYENEDISWGTKKDLYFVIIDSFVAGLIAKIPDFFASKFYFNSEDVFYSRNIGFIVFPTLIAYFAWKSQLPMKRLYALLGAIVISAIYINLLPYNPQSDTLVLACFHLPLLLWSFLGVSFVGNEFTNVQRRLDFLRYNGDVVIMTTLILISGGILTGITLGLFSLINIQIEEFYFKYIAIWGLAAAPIVGTYLVRTNPQLVSKVSPVIAKVFTPLVLITLVIYLGAVVYSGKDPFNDRDFLIIFNVLLVGVMAIILFSIAEITKNTANKLGIYLLLGLAIVTIIINGIALSAILFRISEWGMTPNRLAILGGNVLILTNLLLVTFRLLKVVKDSDEMIKVESSIASFLPVYTIWTVVVTFLFPVLFWFR